MHIAWTFPEIPSTNVMFMLEAMTFKIGVVMEKTVSPSEIVAEAWTNIYDKDNPEGLWHSIPLNLIEAPNWDAATIQDQINVTFGNAVILTSDGEYRFTFRIRQKQATEWIWRSGFMQDGIIEVRPPFGEKWSQGSNYNKILGTVHLGNFIAASKADQLGFDAVLNLADNLDLIPEKFSSPVLYTKIPLRDGAVNPIPEDKLKEAVEWLQKHGRQYKKVLVNCRAGIGRAGSVAVAYVFAENPTMSYEDAYNYVFKRRFVYPHKGLRDSLYTLFPRKQMYM